jgi:hypothetical protein
LNATTPAVTTATCAYCDAGYLRPATTPPIMTGIILHDFPNTCVGNETNRSASFANAIASICETPLVAMAATGTRVFGSDRDRTRSALASPRPDRASRNAPTAPTAVFTPRSTMSTRNVAEKRSPA